MTVSWDEVPCSGQNGPITGYLLSYTSTAFSDTVNITGGDNRQYNFVKLIPYTYYIVTVTAYNVRGTGPTSSEVIQQTKEAGKSIIIFVSYLTHYNHLSTCLSLLILVVEDFIVTPLNTTAVWLMWQTPQIPDILYYTVYYNKSSDIGMTNFSYNAINGVIGGLVSNSADYQFTISVTIDINNGVPQEVTLTQLTAPGMCYTFFLPYK